MLLKNDTISYQEKLAQYSRDGKLVDINVLTFVCIHELSHIGNETIGHDDAFWEFFKELLIEAINIGVYIKYDYKKFYKVFLKNFLYNFYKYIFISNY